MSPSFVTSLQCPDAAMNQAHLLESEGAKVCVTFVGPDVETSVATLVEPFQLGGFHMMCLVTHCTDHAIHTIN